MFSREIFRSPGSFSAKLFDFSNIVCGQILQPHAANAITRTARLREFSDKKVKFWPFVRTDVRG